MAPIHSVPVEIFQPIMDMVCRQSTFEEIFCLRLVCRDFNLQTLASLARCTEKRHWSNVLEICPSICFMQTCSENEDPASVHSFLSFAASFIYVKPHAGEVEHDDFSRMIKRTIDPFFQEGDCIHNGDHKRNYINELLNFIYEVEGGNCLSPVLNLMFSSSPTFYNKHKKHVTSIHNTITAAIILDRTDMLGKAMHDTEQWYTNTDWIYALVLMLDYGRLDMIRLVFTQKSKVPIIKKHAGNLLLLQACKDGDVSTVRKLAADGISVRNCNSYLLEAVRFPLTIAQDYGHSALVAVLRGLGATDPVLNERQKARIQELKDAEAEGKRWPNALANMRQ